MYFLFFIQFILLQPFEVNDLLQALNFSKVLNCLVALNKATEGKIVVLMFAVFSFLRNFFCPPYSSFQ